MKGWIEALGCLIHKDETKEKNITHFCIICLRNMTEID